MPLTEIVQLSNGRSRAIAQRSALSIFLETFSALVCEIIISRLARSRVDKAASIAFVQFGFVQYLCVSVRYIPIPKIIYNASNALNKLFVHVAKLHGIINYGKLNSDF